jgi:hypothetical protein
MQVQDYDSPIACYTAAWTTAWKAQGFSALIYLQGPRSVAAAAFSNVAWTTAWKTQCFSALI